MTSKQKYTAACLNINASMAIHLPSCNMEACCCICNRSMTIIMLTLAAGNTLEWWLPSCKNCDRRACMRFLLSVRCNWMEIGSCVTRSSPGRQKIEERVTARPARWLVCASLWYMSLSFKCDLRHFPLQSAPKEMSSIDVECFASATSQRGTLHLKQFPNNISAPWKWYGSFACEGCHWSEMSEKQSLLKVGSCQLVDLTQSCSCQGMISDFTISPEMKNIHPSAHRWQILYDDRNFWL